MGLLGKLFSKSKDKPEVPEAPVQAVKEKSSAHDATDQAVIVDFNYGQEDLAPFFKLEEEIENAIKAAGVGEYDGNEIAVDGSHGCFYCYGPDADKLLMVVEPILKKSALLSKVFAMVRYGPPEDGVTEKKVEILP